MKNAYTINVEMKKAVVGEKVVLKNIFFETNSFELKLESFPEIGKLITLLNANPKLKIEISGHTDNVGDPAMNLSLSSQGQRKW